MSIMGGGRGNTSTTYGGGTAAAAGGGALTAQGVVAQLAAAIANSSGGTGGVGTICTGCEPNVPFVTTLIEFVSILESLKSSIDKYYPSINVGMKIEGRFAAGGTMDVRYAARLGWINAHRETEGRFDATNARHIYLLKDEFLKLGVNWRIDQWLRDWEPSA